jgi:hypothetical protein
MAPGAGKGRWRNLEGVRGAGTEALQYLLARSTSLEIRWPLRMKISLLKVTCLVTAGAFLVSAPIARAQIPYVPSLPFHNSSTAEKVVTAVVIAATIYAIARYEATEHQRQVAEMRARQSYARMSAQRRANMKAKKVRYIAVDTEKGSKSSPKAKRTVMIYDTQTQKVASNTAYDVEKTPAVGTTAKIDSYSAEYVGSGL